MSTNTVILHSQSSLAAANDGLAKSIALYPEPERLSPVERSAYRLCNKLTGETTSIERYSQGHPGHIAIQRYIANVFQKVHDAKLDNFMPELFGVPASGELAAAVGIRRLDTQPVFLEQYLECPVEQCVSEIAGRPVSRRQLVEVGNLAATSIGSSRTLICFLVFYLASQGYSWAVCTAANSVRAALKRSGVAFQEVCAADPDRLGQAQQRWGSYYQTNPSVVVIDLHHALLAIRDRFEFYER